MLCVAAVNLTKKDTGIYQGPPRDGTKADCILTLTDENLVGLASGKLNGTEVRTRNMIIQLVIITRKILFIGFIDVLILSTAPRIRRFPLYIIGPVPGCSHSLNFFNLQTITGQHLRHLDSTPRLQLINSLPLEFLAFFST